jgi:ankyrin repeat protein
MLIAIALAAAADPAAFLAAVRTQDLPGVQRMLEQDPSLASARDDKGSAVSSALGTRVGEGFLPRRRNRVLDALLRRHPQLTPWEVCSVGTAEQVRTEVEKDAAFVKTYSKNGWTPLHAAAYGDNVAAIAVLVQAGADVNARAKNKFDNTPLQVSMLTQSVRAAKALVDAGADVNARQAEGFTALQGAAESGDVESIRLLLAAGADPAVVTPSGKTALGMARERKHTQAARVLESALAKKQ